MARILVWHRSDLRVTDNPALAAAADDGDPVPVFVIDPEFCADGLACDDRVLFCFECVDALDDLYRERGSSLALLHGDPVERLTTLAEERGWAVYYNRDTTARYGHERDRAVADHPRFSGFDADAVRRDAADPRDGWQAHAEAHFAAEPPAAPDDLPANPLDDDLTTDAAADRYDLTAEKTAVPRGGRGPAEARLERFLDTIHDYPGNISAPADAEDHCSRLSAYFAFGALSVREAYRAATRTVPDCTARELFVERLYWNQHYTQKLEDFPRATEVAINPVFRGLHRDDHDPALVRAWKRGETGVPLVDASMRALVETGYVNFRMRAMVASYFCYVLREWWKRGADFMYYHLIDADPAINYEQWQLQANLTGVHPVRVYDPYKNQREHDPDGEFVRQYVPELRPVPDEHLVRPEKMSRAVQDEVGVRLGEDYPRPVVEYERRASEARDLYASLDERAKEAMGDPEIRARASLSRRHETVEDDPDDDGGQASLADF